MWNDALHELLLGAKKLACIFIISFPGAILGDLSKQCPFSPVPLPSPAPTRVGTMSRPVLLGLGVEGAVPEGWVMN